MLNAKDFWESAHRLLVLTAHVTTNQLDQFLSLEEDDKIEEKFTARAREVEGLKEIDIFLARRNPFLALL